jgi:WD40 repeat protein
MSLLPLPTIPLNSINREFVLDDVKVEITSLDVAPHGGFVIVGCSSGVILFFDVTDNHSQRNGTFLAHIRAKGMHTSFRLNVKITEDSRMCFAGVLKGSSEMVAIDLSLYQLNWNRAIREKGGKLSRGAPSPSGAFDNSFLHYFRLFSYSDAKLRGFGAATCVPISSTSTVAPEGTDLEQSVSSRKYLLACGMGIKNVHVWQVIIHDYPLLTPSSSSSTSTEVVVPEEKKRDEWSCIYDVASNGITITHLGFRNDGRELLTKSHGCNIRVWDVTKYQAEPLAKPQYEDIANTFDVKCFLENSTFTYGGIYEFAAINVDKNIPKEANRNVLELPPVNCADVVNMDDSSSRRRSRAMREVSDVLSTPDGAHVLILCSDGGVLYYKHPEGKLVVSFSIFFTLF